MRKGWLVVLPVVGMMIAGCSGAEVTEPSVKQDTIKGSLVNREAAVGLAQVEYHLREVKDVQIRPLDDAEWKLIPSVAQDKTPIYWVIEGVAESGEKVRVFVSSNEKKHHFFKR